MIIRLEPDGPAGVGMKPTAYVDPADVIEGEAIEKGHTYYTHGTEKFSAGVWECSPCIERIQNYPFDEFAYILQGSVVVTLEDGTTQTFEAGDCFIMKHGTNCTWHMPETLRKYYVIFGPYS